jgi:hypothetical protein
MPNPSRRSAAAGIGPLVTASLLCLLSLSLTAPAASAQDTPPTSPPSNARWRRSTSPSAPPARSPAPPPASSSATTPPSASRPAPPSASSSPCATPPSPWVGFEFNFGNARTVQNYTFTAPTPNVLPGGAQTGNRELTLGYVAHPRKIFGTPALRRRRRRHHPLPAHPQRRRGPALPVPRRLLLPRRPRLHLPRLPLRRPPRLPPAHLPRPRLPAELPHHHPPRPHLRTHLRLLRQVLRPASLLKPSS